MTGDRRAVFLDRDGTLIEHVHYLSRADLVRIRPGVPAALRKLREAGFDLVLATNQSGIGRGYYGEEDYLAVNRAMFDALDVPFLDARHCPHVPEDGCACRKPAPGLLLAAAREHGIRLEASYMAGDAESDALAGIAAGCRASFLLGEGPAPTGARLAPDLPAAAASILEETGK